MPGTTVNIGKNSNIQFTGKLTANGTINKPIIFNIHKHKSSLLLDKITNNSQMANIKVRGGSRYNPQGRQFEGALNIFNSEQIIINGLNINSDCENCYGIDIYNSSVTINKFEISNIKSGAIRVDNSKLNMDNGILDNSLDKNINCYFSSLDLNNTTISRFFQIGLSLKSCTLTSSNLSIKNGSIGIHSSHKLRQQNIIFKNLKKETQYEN